jgi:VIT family protein
VSEVLFGLIMVLTFTGSLSVAEADRAEVRTMLIGALGCNLAWGIIDGVLYLMGCMAESSRSLLAFRALRRTPDPEAGRRIIAGALPPLIASVLKPEDLESMRLRLAEVSEPSGPARLRKQDYLGGLGVFLWVFLTTFPVVIPFLFMKQVHHALRASNAVALVLLFVAGWAFGRITGRRPWVMGVSMVVVGLVLVALTMALGG